MCLQGSGLGNCRLISRSHGEKVDDVEGFLGFAFFGQGLCLVDDRLFVFNS